MDNMITYQSLFNQELFFDETNKVRINSIVIPKIQRPYAQGREDAGSTNVRNKFLSEIFRVLSSEEDVTLDLNFIYGTVVNQGTDGYALELLDGQQRITTLFLLHWYLAVRELEDESEVYNAIIAALSRFSYETRSSSREFCRHLSEFKPIIDKAPSQVIKQSRWFYKSYEKDSTICAMLVMLDAIHEEYISLENPSLFPKLDRLQFYILSLGQFDLSEELYVKMNARGLALSSFENFKADLLDYLSTGNMPEDELADFSTNLDTRWIDIFWNKENELFDVSYLSFFYRYFVARYIIDHTEISPIGMRKDKWVSSIYTDAEKSQELEYWGFDSFGKEIEFGKTTGIEYMSEASRMLDIMLENKEELKTSFSAVWEDGDTTDYFCNKSAKFEHSTLILWSSFMEFCRLQKNFDLSIFKQWMRIVTNIVENANIDSLEPTTVISRTLSSMLAFASPRMDQGMTLHAALADYDVSGNVRRAVVEEVQKCKYIASDPIWEQEFINAEKHPFLKGTIGFYLSDNLTIEGFRHRTDVVFTMFNEKGITEEYRKEHILIRALISQLSSWEELNKQYITETTDATKYLKNLIAGNTSIHELFKHISSLSSKDEIVAALNLETTKESCFKYTHSDPFWQKSVPHCYERLRRDIRLYDWMARIEGKRKCRVYYGSGFVNIATPNAYYDRIVIDCERAEIIRRLICDYDFEFTDKAQNGLDKVGDVFCYEVALRKSFDTGVLSLKFNDDHNLFVSFRMLDRQQCDAFVNAFGDSCTISSEDANVVNIASCKYGFMDTLETINEIVKDSIASIAQVSPSLNEPILIQN